MGELLSIPTLILQIVNFILFVIIAYYLFYKPFKDITQARQNVIKENLAKAEEIRKEIEQIRVGLESKLNKINEEREKILSEAVKEAENIKNYIIEEAQNKANEIKNKAIKEIEYAKKQALNEIKDTYINVVTELAKGVLKDVVDENVNAKIIKTASEKLKNIN
jgi:F-type H+-transporting ATPase subunit b